MKTILVTGGAGFIGSNFIRHTLASTTDINIVNFDALTYASNPECIKEYDKDGRHIFCHASICDESAVRNVVCTHRPDYVVHFAAHTHVDRSITSPRDFINTNILGTYTLLDVIRQYDRPANFKFIHVSTDEVYGSASLGKPFTEETRYDPSSPYSASKASADHLVRAYHRTYGIPTVITNCCNNYGPYQFPEKLIPLMILNGFEGKPLPVYGSGGNIRDWIYVDDHVNALWSVIARGIPGETYNIGADCELSNIEVVNKICDALGKLSETGAIPQRNYRGLIEFVRDRPGHDLVYSICNHKIKSLGWAPTVSFDDGLNMTVKWYYENRGWISKIHDRRRLGDAQGNSTSGRCGDETTSDNEGGE